MERTIRVKQFGVFEALLHHKAHAFCYRWWVTWHRAGACWWELHAHVLYEDDLKVNGLGQEPITFDNKPESSLYNFYEDRKPITHMQSLGRARKDIGSFIPLIPSHFGKAEDPEGTISLDQFLFTLQKWVRPHKSSWKHKLEGTLINSTIIYSLPCIT